jgi:multidrug efflux pump subunit AcrA (membrane-fusion protein)
MEETEKSGVRKQNTRSTFFKRWWIPLVLVVLLAAVAYVILADTGKAKLGSSRSEHGTPSPAFPVVAVEAKKAHFNIYATGLGSVTPVQTVIVRTQVDGQLMEVHFDEGQIVNQGDLLARIDPRPFEVQLLQAEGQMVRDQALLVEKLASAFSIPVAPLRATPPPIPVGVPSELLERRPDIAGSERRMAAGGPHPPCPGLRISLERRLIC